MSADFTTQALVDRGVLFTHEDAAIRTRASWIFRHHYEFGDRKDAALMALADAKSALRRAIENIVNNRTEIPMSQESNVINAGRAAIFYNALSTALIVTRQQMGLASAKQFKGALELQISAYEGERAALARAFPELAEAKS